MTFWQTLLIALAACWATFAVSMVIFISALRAALNAIARNADP